VFKFIWMPVEEAIGLLGIKKFLEAARAGAIECRGNKSLFGHDWSSIPARDWWHGSVPMIDGRRVAGISWGFGATASARWLDFEARRADAEALLLVASHSSDPGPKKGPERAEAGHDQQGHPGAPQAFS
jgi:hypothetical protein